MKKNSKLVIIIDICIVCGGQGVHDEDDLQPCMELVCFVCVESHILNCESCQGGWGDCGLCGCTLTLEDTPWLDYGVNFQLWNLCAWDTADTAGCVNIDDETRIFRPDMECEICGKPPFRVSFNVWHCDEHKENANCRNYAISPSMPKLVENENLKKTSSDSLSNDDQ